jgi:hypothetical protein
VTFPEIDLDGFAYVSITDTRTSGTGYLRGPDGSRAAIRWEVGDGRYVSRLEGPTAESWGAYGLGFVDPVAGTGDLEAELRALLPKLRTLYQRMRGVS